MTITTDSSTPPPGGTLALLDPLYRLALLAHGPGEAEAATRQALGAPRAGAGADLATLAPLLLDQPGGAWDYEASPRQLFRAGLTGESGQQLLLALASLAPAQRLALGLTALQGLSWERAHVLLEGAGATATTPDAPASEHTDPRPALGAALGVLPNVFETTELPAACARCVIALIGEEERDETAREHLQDCQECQSYRKAWRGLNALLRTALPALFTTPPEVLQRLAELEQQRSAPPPRPRQEPEHELARAAEPRLAWLANHPTLILAIAGVVMILLLLALLNM
jgi:hypothetical protein